MSFVSSAYQRICVSQFHAEESHHRSETIDDTKLRVQKPNVLYWRKSDTNLTISKRQPDELIAKVKAYASLTGIRTETRAELDEFCTQLCKTTATCSIRLVQFLIAGNLTIAKAQKMQTIQTKSMQINLKKFRRWYLQWKWNTQNQKQCASNGSQQMQLNVFCPWLTGIQLCWNVLKVHPRSLPRRGRSCDQQAGKSFRMFLVKSCLERLEQRTVIPTIGSKAQWNCHSFEIPCYFDTSTKNLLLIKL